MRNLVLVPLLFILAVSFVPSTIAQEVRDNTMTNLPLNRSSDTIQVTIRADKSISPEKIFEVKNAILSIDTVTINGKIYFKGWQGALLEGSKHHTQFVMPIKLKITDFTNDSQGIIIILTSNQNPSDTGFTTYTTINEKMTKVKVIIYNVNDLTNDELEAITRHEFGHALGLGHSTIFGNLMNHQIDMNTPFISKCNINALISLYDGQINKLYVEDQPL